MEYIKFESLYTQEGEEQAVQAVGELFLRGDIAEMERQLCAYTGAEHCIGISNATTGLLLALRAAGVGEGDGVLCTPFGFFATRQVIEMLGALPLPVDINPGNWNIDPYCLEYVLGRRAREKQPPPKALIAVDLFGLPCDFDVLGEICERNGITLIEDMSQALGASYHGVKTGNFGRFSVTSFFPGRTLGESGGGAVFCHTPEDERKLRSLHGTPCAEKDLCRQSAGALLVSQSLRRFDEECARRRKVAACYAKNLEGIVKMQLIPEGSVSAYNQYAVLARNAEMRDHVLAGLQEKEIPCRPYSPAPLQRTANSLERVMLHGAQSVAERIFLLPMHPYLSPNVIEHVSACVAELVWEKE